MYMATNDIFGMIHTIMECFAVLTLLCVNGHYLLFFSLDSLNLKDACYIKLGSRKSI